MCVPAPLVVIELAGERLDLVDGSVFDLVHRRRAEQAAQETLEWSQLVSDGLGRGGGERVEAVGPGVAGDGAMPGVADAVAAGEEVVEGQVGGVVVAHRQGAPLGWRLLFADEVLDEAAVSIGEPIDTITSKAATAPSEIASPGLRRHHRHSRVGIPAGRA